MNERYRQILTEFGRKQSWGSTVLELSRIKRSSIVVIAVSFASDASSSSSSSHPSRVHSDHYTLMQITTPVQSMLSFRRVMMMTTIMYTMKTRIFMTCQFTVAFTRVWQTDRQTEICVEFIGELMESSRLVTKGWPRFPHLSEILKKRSISTWNWRWMLKRNNWHSVG
jgi:hypothetical protein